MDRESWQATVHGVANESDATRNINNQVASEGKSLLARACAEAYSQRDTLQRGRRVGKGTSGEPGFRDGASVKVSLQHSREFLLGEL